MPRLVSLVLAAALSAAGLQSDDNQPAQPFRIADNLYYVGARDISSYLITTKAGNILIDGGYPEAVPIIRANVASLGFRVEDVKVLLNAKPEGPNPFVDPQGYRLHIERAERRFRDQLRREAVSAPSSARTSRRL